MIAPFAFPTLTETSRPDSDPPAACFGYFARRKR